MRSLSQFTRLRQAIVAFMTYCFFSGIAFAADFGSTGMPWEGPLEKILASLSGPVAKVLGVIVIMLAGFGIAFGEAGSGMRRLFQIVMGLSIAFTATSLMLNLFGVGGS